MQLKYWVGDRHLHELGQARAVVTLVGRNRGKK